MILLDTNIISEIYRPEPNTAVIAWIDSQPSPLLYLCTPVLAELRFGMERFASGARKDRLRATIDRFESDIYRDRILVLDLAGAAEYGRVAAKRQKLGRPIEQMDALIAAIALVNGAAVATRNVRDFVDLGIDLINPFEMTAGR
jgi:predicted nucleic acid-binding protein